ncbi:MAG: hypothetical protein IPO21_18800 [Bacteroidales bacterium]|nr:hypothetical protein [Bacteroidales bacterium]
MLFLKSNPAKKLGLIDDQKGIIKRYQREKTNWDKHLNHSKQYILDTTYQKKYKSITILGSGWHLDVPIAQLAADFEKVYLIDIYHPQQVRYNCRNLQNVSFLTQDITGGLIECFAKKIKEKSFVLNEVQIPAYSEIPQTDYVVSLNLLSQLDILLVDSIKHKCTALEAEYVTLRKKIQLAHLTFLQKFNYSAIFDFKEYVFDSNHNYESECDTVFVSPKDVHNQKDWIWKFDSQGYYYENKIVEFAVKAVSNFEFSPT